MATNKRTGLGRGIGALIPQAAEGERAIDVFFATGDAATAEPTGASNGGAKGAKQPSSSKTTDESSQLREVPGATLVRLELDDIVPNRAQPRTEFDEDALEELTHSIREFGVFQPVVVREIMPAPAAGLPRYELIMGERRFRASKRAGRTDIPAIIRGVADEHMLRDALLENLHRAQLNPLEEASAYQQLLSDFGITQQELAEKIGRSRPQISNTIRLLGLPENVQARVAAGVISAGHARAILALDGDASAMQKLADKIINEGLSVRQAEAVAASTPSSKPPVKPRAGGVQAQLNDIAERLGDRFNTKVHIRLGAKKGQLTIDFATVADLTRILNELGDEGFNAKPLN